MDKCVIHFFMSDLSAESAPARLEPHFEVSPLAKFAVAASCCCITEFITFPLDVTKTRMALQGEKNGFSHGARNPFLITRQIVQQDGIRGLYAGVGAGLARQFVYGGVGVSLYVPIRNAIVGDDPANAPIWKKMIAAMIVGGVGQFVSSPTDVLKVRLQADRRFVSQGIPPKYLGSFDALQKIYREGIVASSRSPHFSYRFIRKNFSSSVSERLGGFTYFYTGVWPNVQRAAIMNAASTSSYDHIKHSIDKWLGESEERSFDAAGRRLVSWKAQALACGLSGLISAIISTPFDVIKTRIMNQSINSQPGVPLLYTSSMDCLVKTVKNEGFWALYRGFTPAYARLAPWQMIFFTSYEYLCKIVGIEVI